MIPSDMAEGQPNYNPPGGPGIPSEETWRTEAGEKTARPGETRDDASASGEAPGGADHPPQDIPLGAGKGSTGTTRGPDSRQGSTSADEG